MPTIIVGNQTCGVPGRNIHDNLMILRDCIDYINFNDIGNGVVSIDQERAFDRIECEYVYSIMGENGYFPHTGLIQWCKLIYSNPVSQVIVNN